MIYFKDYMIYKYVIYTSIWAIDYIFEMKVIKQIKK